jgi:acetoin utilization protein AcuB
MGKTMTVDQVMSRGVFTIGKEQTLETAHLLMEKHQVRHLPVMEGGKVVGIVSERDLYLLETLRDVHQFDVTVENAMSADPFTVKPHTPLAEVCDAMAQHKYGAALITEGPKVVGMFTAVDALKVLSAMLQKPHP